MKRFVIYRNIDSVGRVVIPADFRKFFNIEPYSAVRIELTDEGMLIKPVIEGGN